MALLFADRADEATAHYEAARAAAVELGDVVMEIHFASDLAGCYYVQKEYSECVELLATARTAADGIGYRRHLAYNLINEAELRSMLGDDSAAACAAVAMRRSLELGDLVAAADAAHAWIRSLASLAASACNWRRIVEIDAALGRSGFAAESGIELALAEARVGHEKLARRAADEAVDRASGLELTQVVRRAQLARVLAAAGRRTARGWPGAELLLAGLSGLADDDGLEDIERAEITVERWRATGAVVDHDSAVDLLARAFDEEPSPRVRAWFNELGVQAPGPPTRLPPPVGIGRARTTRSQFEEALRQLETALTSQRRDSTDVRSGPPPAAVTFT